MQRIRILVFGGLAALFAVTVAFSPSGIVATLLFSLVVVLVCVWFVRLAPWGDMWHSAAALGISGRAMVAVLLMVAAVWGIFRLAVLTIGA